MLYWFIGIKGSGMSALAQVMFDLGYQVEGSDKSLHFFTEDALVEKGIKIHDFSQDNIKENMIVIKGNAFNDENEEVKKAKELNLKIYSYQEMIDVLTKDKKLIAVSGCHGKTTTSTMINTLLNNVGTSALIGDGTGIGNKNSDLFVLEACEWKRHFLSYHPYYSIITNVELDHTDYYKDLDDVIDAFTSFANNARKSVIIYGDSDVTRNIKINKPTLYYGFNDNNDLVAKNIVVDGEFTNIDVYIKKEYYGSFRLPFAGDHMVLNVLASIALCYLEGIDKVEISNQLLKIKHAKRRFIEEKFKDNILIDDYAHHPTEVRVTIEAAKKKYPNKFIVAVFKAHTRSRVKAFYKEFADALNIADKSYIMDIGEDRIEVGYDDVTCNNIIECTKNGEYISIESANKLLQYHNSVIIFMSSKDIYFLANEYKKLSE